MSFISSNLIEETCDLLSLLSRNCENFLYLIAFMPCLSYNLNACSYNFAASWILPSISIITEFICSPSGVFSPYPQKML